MNNQRQNAPYPQTRPAGAGRLAGLLAAGGVAGSVLASGCCIVPLALFSLGISGAWISTLTGLAPYQPVFLTLAAVMVAGGFLSVRRSRVACEVDDYCARPVSRYVTLGALWLSASVLVVVILWPWLVPILLGG